MAGQPFAPYSGGDFRPLARLGPGAYLGPGATNGRKAMKEDVFNMETRKFLKTLGVTSQREIERAVEAAIASGKIKGNEKLRARAILTIEQIGLSHTVEDDIALE